jgi:hypothetical protein
MRKQQAQAYAICLICWSKEQTSPASLGGHRTPGTSLLIVSVQNAETNLAKSVFCRSGEDVLYILADAHAV